METLTNFLNAAGVTFVPLATQMLWQAGLLVTVLLAIDVIILRRARAVVRYALWLLVPLKLVLPPTLAVPSSPAYWLTTDRAAAIEALAQAPEPALAGAGLIAEGSDVGPQQDSQGLQQQPLAFSLQVAAGPHWTWYGVVALIWLLGSLAWAVWLAARACRVYGILRGARPAKDDLEQQLHLVAKQMGLRRVPRLLLTESVSSPAVCGWLRPAILIAPSLVERLSDEQLRNVWLHELAHVKRGDLWLNQAQVILQIVYWWHPFVWIANERIRRLREAATDETVVVVLEGEAEGYAETLITVGRSALRRSVLSLELLGILESSGRLRTRVEYLLEGGVPRSARVGKFQCVVLCLLGALLLPMTPRSAAVQEQVDRSPVEQEPSPAPSRTVETNLAKIRNPEQSADQLMTRVYRVDPERMAKALNMEEGSTPTSLQEKLGNHFKSLGFSTLPPNAIFFNDRTGSLMVRAPADAIAIVEQSIESLVPYQHFIQLEARLYRIPQRELTAMGVQQGANRDATDGATAQVVLRSPLTGIITRALEGHTGSNTLVFPKVTTLSDRVASLELSDPPAKAGESMALGSAVLNVHPLLLEDGLTFRLNTVLQLTELLKLGEESAVPSRASGGTYSVNATGYFNRAITNQITLVDGDTVLICVRGAQLEGVATGGERDYVLVLRPALIDPAGNLLNRDGDKQAVRRVRSRNVQFFGAITASISLKQEEEPLFLSDAILRLGPPDLADLARVKVHRLDANTGEEKTLKVDVRSILRQGTSDLALEPGDRVEVPKKWLN